MNKAIKYSLVLILVFLVLLNIEKTIAEEKNEKFIIIPEKYQIIGTKLFEYDNGYLIISNLFSDTEPDLFSGITNISKNKTILWNKIIGRKAPDNWISKVIYIPNKKSFILLGTVNYKLYYGGTGFGWIVMIDENGNVLWDTTIKESKITHIVDGFVYSNDLFITGNIYNDKSEESFKNSILIKMDMNGNIISKRDFPFKIDLIEKVSDNEFLITGLNQNSSFIYLVDTNGNLIKQLNLNHLLNKETTKFILLGKRLLIIFPLKEQLSVKFLDLNNPDISIKDEKLEVKDLCSIFNFKVIDDKTAIFSGKSCKDKLNVKIFKISLFDNNFKLELMKDINFKDVVKKGELLDASYDGDISIGVLDNNKIWIYKLAGFSNANTSFAKDLEFIKIPEGLSYFDIDGDGVKDIIINAEFLTPFGGNLYRAYSFYLKREKALQYVPIQLENDVLAESAIYTHSISTGCGTTMNNDETTNLSAIRMLKNGKNIYLFYVKKDCSNKLDPFNNKCKFKVIVYKYDEEDQGFAKYKNTITNKPYCDAEEVFSHEKNFLLNLIK